MQGPWLSWVYCYSVGGALFVASVLVALKSGAARWSLWTDRQLLLAMTGGLIAWAAIHALWIHWATH